MSEIWALLWTSSARTFGISIIFSSSLFQQLRNIRNIRKKLDFDTAKILVQSLILSKLDYCNSLLAGTPECHLSRLQRVQNMACRVVCNLRKFDHVSPSMCSLHWLKVRERIAFKIAYMVYCCTNGLAPDYLADLLPSTTHNRSLRSSTSGSLPPARCRTSLASVGSFSVGWAKRSGITYHLQSEPKGPRMVLGRCLKTFLFGHSHPKDIS